MYKTNLNHHIKFYCQKEPSFGCTHCPYKAKTKGNLKIHFNGVHLKIKRTRSTKNMRFAKVFIDENK
jgi:hypothetical protein